MPIVVMRCIQVQAKVELCESLKMLSAKKCREIIPLYSYTGELPFRVQPHLSSAHVCFACLCVCACIHVCTKMLNVHKWYVFSVNFQRLVVKRWCVLCSTVV